MTSYRSRLGFGAVVVMLALPVIGRADKDQKLPNEAFVQFAHLVTPAPGANTVAGAVTHFLNPDDVSIKKGGTVTFVINNGGHGLAIHEVSRETTRDDIAADLCQGGADEADREGRFAVCNATIVTASGIVGTQNLAYQVTDGDGNVVIDVPTNVGNNNPRVDDPRSNRLIATSGASKACAAGQGPPMCDPTEFGGNPAGAFLTGSVIAIPLATPPVPATVGQRIRVQFLKNGRYLVICMNRAHLLNDHMFGFVNVGSSGEGGGEN